MPNLSGSFSGKATVQTTMALRDIPNHELNLLEVRGLQKTSDNLWKDAKITYWGSGGLGRRQRPAARLLRERARQRRPRHRHL